MVYFTNTSSRSSAVNGARELMSWISISRSSQMSSYAFFKLSLIVNGECVKRRAAASFLEVGDRKNDGLDAIDFVWSISMITVYDLASTWMKALVKVSMVRGPSCVSSSPVHGDLDSKA